MAAWVLRCGDAKRGTWQRYQADRPLRTQTPLQQLAKMPRDTDHTAGSFTAAMDHATRPSACGRTSRRVSDSGAIWNASPRCG